MIQRPEWPNSAKCALMLSVDFDAESNWLARDPVNNQLRPGIISQGTYGPKVGIHKVLELFDEEDVKATFFVPGWVVDHRTASVAAVLEAGHEIAHHGYLHTPVQPGDTASELEELERGLEAMDRMFGVKPVGYRAPYGDPTPNLMNLLAANGFLYDSSLMDDASPYQCVLKDGTRGPVELPWHWSLDDAVYMLHALSVLRPIFPNAHVLDIWKEEFDGAYDWTGFIDIIMHPQFTGRPSRISLMRDFIRYAKGFDGVWIARADEIARAWLDHNSKNVPDPITPFIDDYR